MLICHYNILFYSNLKLIKFAAIINTDNIVMPDAIDTLHTYERYKQPVGNKMNIELNNYYQ